MAQLRHSMWVAAARSAVLSIVTRGGKWVESKVHADPLYQHLLLICLSVFPSNAAGALSQHFIPIYKFRGEIGL